MLRYFSKEKSARTSPQKQRATMGSSLPSFNRRLLLALNKHILDANSVVFFRGWRLGGQNVHGGGGGRDWGGERCLFVFSCRNPVAVVT